MAYGENIEDRIGRDTTDRYIGHKASTPDPNANMCNAAPPSGGQYDPTAFLNDLFSYHPPRPDQIPKYQAIRSAAKHFAEIVMTNTPMSADQQNALLLIRMATHMANAAVALNGRF